MKVHQASLNYIIMIKYLLRSKIINFLKLKISLCFFLFTLLYSDANFGDVTLITDVVISGKYSLSTFVDPNINLWQVVIQNHYQGDEPLDLRLEIEMKKDNVIVIWGVSKPILLMKDTAIQTRTNMDFTGSDLSHYEENSGFRNQVESSGVLPAGQYELNIRAYSLGLYSEQSSNEGKIDSGDKNIEGTLIFELVEEDLIQMNNLNIPEEISLLNPVNYESIYDMNPWFRWESPGFGLASSPIMVEYRISVALFNPELHSSLTDALEDETSIYFDSEWGNITSEETGSPQQISIQYPANEKELSCGYQYCWKVEARELIESNLFGANSSIGGLWGWPDPAVSDEIHSFYYGSTLSSNEINSPGTYINTISPIFSITSILCADSYEIWVSDINDSEVNNPIWKSDFFQTANYQYPLSAAGLSPGEKYFWKVRVNPEGDPGPWSSIFSFTINDISFTTPVDGEITNTLFPTFNISSPSGISQYQLLISNSDDIEVNQYNILSETFDFFPFDFPLNNQIILNPGETYFWKVQTIDDNGNMTKLISDNFNISSFSIQPIELSFPESESYNVSLTPFFSWNSPIGVGSYIIEFTTEDDLDFDNIIFTSDVNSSFFLSSNISGGTPFQNGTTYFWRVIPVNNNGIEGTPSDFFSFSTTLDNSDLSLFSSEAESQQIEFDLSLSGIEGKDIYVSLVLGLEEADTYLIKLSTDSAMEDIIEEVFLPSTSLNHSFSGDLLDWNRGYYVQITALSNDENIGELSNIKIIILPPEPGSQEQVSFNIELIQNMIPSLTVEITNSVNNATHYILNLSDDSNMGNILLSESIADDIQYVYQDLDGILNFGKAYYLQLIPIKNNQPYGVSSDINSIFIPNIVPPQLSENLFFWEHSIPQSSSYLIEFSTTEDFTVISYNTISQTNNLDFDNNILQSGTPYYWRVRGLDESGSMFGNYSSPSYFISSGDMAEIEENNETGLIVSMQAPENNSTISTKFPNFNWDNIENAEKYEIIISKNNDLTDIMWHSQNIFNNSTNYPSSGADPLEYNVMYYWSVRAISNNIALGSFSESFSFIISSNFIPELIGPNDISKEIMPYFNWSKIQNTASYGLLISYNNDFTNIIYNNQNILDNVFQYPNNAPQLLYDTEYFWKVVALSENNVALGDYSEVSNFKTPSGIIIMEFIFRNNNE